MEELSVMGLVEVLKHLPRLLKFVAVSSTNSLILNLMYLSVLMHRILISPLNWKLKEKGIKTIHYVSPSVWAWRQNRIYKIAKATHQVLAFLPFEKAFYDRFNVPCRFIGHTMADAIPLKPNRTEACQILGIDEKGRYLAILVGESGERSWVSDRAISQKPLCY